MDNLLILVIIFIFGSAVGSFLNVVAYRSLHGGKILLDRSKCPQCKHLLGPHDLIPILSFVFLSGQCRYCRKKISWQYPLVEISAAFLFVLAYLQLNSSFQGQAFSLEVLSLVYTLFILSVLMVVFITDLKEGIIPDKVIFPAVGITALLKTALAFLQLQEPIQVVGAPTISFQQIGFDAATGVTTGFIFFLIVLLSRGKGMGGGDIKYAAFLGFALGFSSTAVALFLAFLTGASLALILILIGKKRFGQTIAFGPFLSLGAFIALLWGQQITDWYLRINR